MKSVALNAFSRTLSRGPGAKKLRANGRIPAVVYGGQTKPVSVEINIKDIRDVLHGSSSEIILLDLAVEKQPKRLTLVKEIQHHPLTGAMLHVDLHEVAENEKVTISVPVESTGEAIGVKTGGGTLEHVLHKLKIRAFPKDLPEALIVDVSHLEIGKAVHIGEIKAPEGVEIMGDKHIVVLSVAAPVSEAEEAAAAAAAPGAAEVEMTKEKKEEGAEGAAPAAKAGDKAAAKPAAGDKAAAGADKKAEKKK